MLIMASSIQQDFLAPIRSMIRELKPQTVLLVYEPNGEGYPQVIDEALSDSLQITHLTPSAQTFGRCFCQAKQRLGLFDPVLV